MKVALFLGAGASVPFDKPATKGMKEHLIEVSNDDVLDSFLNNDGYRDVEYILQAMRELKRLKNSVAGTYFNRVGHSFNFQRSGGMSFNVLIQRIKDAEAFVEREVYEKYGWNGDHNGTLLKIYNKLFPLILRTKSDIRVFTTNYDRAIEMFCELQDDYALIDGFQRPKPYSEYSRWIGNFDTNSQNAIPVRLYKLHGSLNWKYHRTLHIVKTNEESIPSDSNFSKNVVIMPTLSPKDEEAQEPFARLKTLFEQYMETADVCIVIGFSFRDNINHIFKAFIERGKTLIVISPTAITDFSTRVMNEKPSEQELAEWKSHTAQFIGKSRPDMTEQDRSIHLLQRALEAEKIDEIIRWLEHTFEKLPKV